MWTKREKAMLRAMGQEYQINRDFGDTGDEHIVAALIHTVVRAAREVKEPDYKAMWEELKDNSGNQKACLLEIERRHGGGKA